MTSTPTTPTPSPGRHWLDVANDTQDPYSMIGAAVTGLLAVLVDSDESQGRTEAANDDYLELRREYDDLEAALGRSQQVVADIIAAVKPSTSKLADKVRSIVQEALAATPPAAPAPEPVVEPDAAPPAE